jgi:hypothetical protein
MKTQNTESKKITDIDVRSIQIVDYLFQNNNTTTSSITNILTANKLLTYAGGDIQFISINEKKASYIYNWDF